MIRVVNIDSGERHDKNYTAYIGRPRPLGNPYTIGCWGRDGSIKRFEKDLVQAMAGGLHPILKEMRKEMHRLEAIYKRHGNLILECWCKPLACHGDVIKKYLEEEMGCDD